MIAFTESTLLSRVVIGYRSQHICNRIKKKITTTSMAPCSSPCARCVLRLKNIRLPSQYATRLEDHSKSSCPTCLGILQEKSLNNVTDLVAKLLPNISHNGFIKIIATLPPSASVIREKAMAVAYANGLYSSLNLLPKSHRPSPPITLREALKWTLGARLESMYSIDYSPDAELFIHLTYQHDETVHDTDFITQFERKQTNANNKFANGSKRPRGRDQNLAESTTHVNRVIDSMTDSQFMEILPKSLLPPCSIQTLADVDVTLIAAPVYLAGEYNKYSRTISQTPWFVDRYDTNKKQQDTNNNQSQTRTDLSVEQVVVSGMKKILDSNHTTFTAGGREDVDVRMLGSGRPFIVEVLNSNTVPSCVTEEMIQQMCDESIKLSRDVTVNNLKSVSKSHYAEMRMFESEKKKCYRCLVWTAANQTLQSLQELLEVENGFLLKQKTPLRVLHRRTQAVRERRIYQAKVVRLVSNNFFVLDLIAQAGTYIKEFVHGDNGRTVPNVCAILGCDADILQLDVTSITRENSNPVNNENDDMKDD